MWFTNLQIYRFSKPFTLSAEDIAERLDQKSFRPCGSLELFTYGWVPPLGRYSNELVHVANGNILLCARKEEKILPSAVIRDAVTEKAQAIEEEQGRTVRRKERQEIKEEILQDMMPRAFKKSRHTFAYISAKDNLLIVNSSSAKNAEELLSYLRTTLGSLPVIPPSMCLSPGTTMTRWLTDGNHPDDVIIGNECELREPGDQGGIVRCKHLDLASDEIQTHLETGKYVTKLALSWQDALSFVLSEDLSIKRLRFAQELLEQSNDIDSDDVLARFDNDFNIMTLEFSRFIPSLLNALGGENEDAYNNDTVERAA